MNYLAHAYLSFGDSEILTGNMIADHVKGKLALEIFPTGIRKGIMLHRKIDAYSDTHAATTRAKTLFRADYGLYAGAIMDTLYDHFLANDARIFPSESDLDHFALQTYKKLSLHSDFFPPVFRGYFPYMQEYNWLSGYRKVKRMENALNGLARRAKYMPPVEKAFSIFVSNYYELNQRYDEFINDVIRFVKFEITS